MEIKLHQTLENNHLWTIPILQIRKVIFERGNTRTGSQLDPTKPNGGEDTRKKEELFEVQP